MYSYNKYIKQDRKDNLLFSEFQLMLADYYLYWVNNYISVDLFALHEGLELEFAQSLIDQGRTIQNSYAEAYQAKHI